MSGEQRTLKVACLALLVTTGVLIAALRAAAAQHEDDAGPRLLDAMRELAEQTVVNRVRPRTRAALVAQPVFRYSDPPRRIEDATLWLWAEGGRPVALQKIEAMTRFGRPAWTFCFASLSEERLAARWPDDKTFESSGGLRFEPLPDPPRVAPANAQLKRHLREVARRFAAEIDNAPDGSNVEQMRLLPRPIYEYGDGQFDVLAGSIFGFASSGTNPDAYLMLEVLPDQAGAARWRYAFARMTTGGLRFTLDGREVWSAEWIHPTPAAFDAWTFFFEPRS